jgi:hypothetical protein
MALFGCLNHSHLFLTSIKSRAACASLDFFVFPAYKRVGMALFGCLNHSHLFLTSIKSRAACASLDFFVPLFGWLNHSHLFLTSIKSRAACASLDFFVFPAYKSELLTLLNKKIPTLCVEISFVTPFGFEPKTYCLEGSCSIQLSYGANIIVQLLRFVSPFLSIKKGG